MDLTALYQKGEALLRQRDIGLMLEGVETGFVPSHDRRILDRYSFQQRCIDALEATTACQVLGISLTTPVIMSAMTMPIPAIVEKGLLLTALGLKAAGSLMWTGTPIPQNLKELAASGVALAANVKPFQDRTRMFQGIEEILEAGVSWLGVEIDAGVGTKIRDRPMATGCSPLSFKELQEVRKKVAIPLIFKGVLSAVDALKSLDAGADGIIVSNHGAHTLDYLAHPLQVMEEVMAAVQGRMVVMIDGGFRRGSDVLKGLAFGASLVGLGRPILYGLAAAGQEGVQGVVEGITQELKRIMTMVGASDPTRVSRDILVRD